MSVELLNIYGNDLTVVNAARVSYGKESEAFNDKDAKLIKYLVEHKHTSVFRHVSLSFRVTCPIYVERQLFKHNVGISTNSISGRYVDFADSYTEIKQFRKQSIDSKQGSAEDLNHEDNNTALFLQKFIIEACQNAYNDLLDLGVSKEQARTLLPLSLNTTFIWTGSLLAFIHMCNLRLKKDAQLETRVIMQAMLDAVLNLEGEPFKHSLSAYGYNK